VEVVIGAPVSLDLRENSTAPLQELKHRLTESLEAVGLNFPDERWQDMAQKFAYIATLGTEHRYFDALKSMERRLPPGAVAAWESMEQAAHGRHVLRHQGVPLFPLQLSGAYAVLTVLLAVPVLAGALLNFPPLAVAWWAGRRFPDDRNVIALWRTLTGVPLLGLWAATWLGAGAATGRLWLPTLYFFLTWLAVHGWYRLKNLAVVAWNGLLHPGLLPHALAVHREILSAMGSTNHEHTDAPATAPA
jgi:hypothetical protein